MVVDGCQQVVGMGEGLVYEQYVKLNKQLIISSDWYFMSSIIDDFIFQKLKSPTETSHKHSREPPLSQIYKNITLNSPHFVSVNNNNKYHSQLILQLHKRQYLVCIEADKPSSTFKVSAVLIEDASFRKIRSKHNEIIFMKELLKRQTQFTLDSTYYIYQGCISMALKLTLYLTHDQKQYKTSQFYNQTIAKNILQFEGFLDKVLVSNDRGQPQSQRTAQFHQQLAVSQMISTTISNFDLSDDKTQYKFADECFQNQKKQLQNIQKYIVNSETYEIPIAQLYQHSPKEYGSAWLKDNFNQLNQSMIKKFKPLLSLAKYSGEKRIDEFIFNMVRVQIREILPKNIGEGGSSLVFMARTFLTYINSVDHCCYLKNQEKVQKVIAIKRLKPELQKKLKQKLEHQKEIVSKLKGGCSFFLPKYYGTEKGTELSNSLLMQFIHGEQLDKFLIIRSQTISLWSKIYILLNVIHGLRHLLNYDIVHLDIKPINIMVCRYLITKIIDYGQAYNKDICDKSIVAFYIDFCPGYTFPYVSPQVYIRYEQLSNSKKKVCSFQFSEKQDVFAFGIIMYQVLFNRKVFCFSNNKFQQIYSKRKVLSRVMLLSEDLESYGDNTLLSTLSSIIVRCLDPRPEKRPKFDWIGISLKLILNSYNSVG